MKAVTADVLLLCYGNPARLDDGLGAAFARRIDQIAPAGVTVEVDYQLTVEDALEVSRHRIVVFVDASVNAPEPFSFSSVRSVRAGSFSSHSLEPENLLGLAEELFGSRAQGYAMGIRGYSFDDFGETLSGGARQNLESAIEFLVPVLRRGNFAEAVALLKPSNSKTTH